LLLPYTGVNVDGIVQDIITASEQSTSDPRDKFLLATLRGVGGGKTRMVEETRIRMGLTYPNWLPIAITFNHKSNVLPSEYAWKDPSIIVAFAVCCRMMAAVYNIPLDEAQNRMDVALAMEGSKSIKTGGNSFAGNLIVGTVQHIAGRVKKAKPAVDSLVLFIDESAKLIEGSDYFTGVKDGYAHLRQTILGERIGGIFKTSLVMTSLNLSVFGITDSERIIIPIELASKLPVDHIVDKIWIPSFHVGSTLIDATEKSMLRWLAASVSAAPRLVELMGKALKAKFANTWSGSRQGLTLRQAMGAVLLNFDSIRGAYYRDIQFPVGIHLHALINEKQIAMDAATLRYVRSSSFTNSISKFPGQIAESQFLVPESALCLLASTRAVRSNYVIEGEIQDEFKKIWGNLLNHITSDPSPPLGQPLEDVFARVLRMRILSMHLKEHSPGQTTLMDLLAINMSAIKYTIGGTPYNAAKISGTGKTVKQVGVARKNLKQWEKDTFEYACSEESFAKKDFLFDLLSRGIIVPRIFKDIRPLSSSQNLTAWKKSIRAINSNLVLKEPRPNNDHCDLMLFARMVTSTTTTSSQTKIGRDEIVLVFEQKSKAENSFSNKVWLGHFIQQGKGPYDQYGKFCQVVASITESDLEDDQGGYLRALKEGRFIFVYATTHEGPTVYLTAQDLPHIQSNSLGVLVLNRDVAKRILGTIFDVYALTRSAL
jgi:hypothetical protein